MYVFHIPEILYCVFVHAFVCLRITESGAPPEPASRRLMERTEHDRAVYLSCKIGDHIQIRIVNLVIFSAGKELVHHIPGQSVRRIACKVIFIISRIRLWIIIRIFCDNRENNRSRNYENKRRKSLRRI